MKKEKQFIRNVKGITLIALVISIIVMLILAGVSLNATIGENGIITQAKNTSYIQSCAILEEWLGQVYIQNYENFDNSQDKITEIINLGVDWIYQPAKEGYGNLNYIVDSDGKALYLIQKDKLPDDIKNQIRDGELNGKTKDYSNYLKSEDVYGVTSNLEVYYCSNGKNSMLGIDKEKIDDDLPTRIIIEDLNSGIGNILSNYDKNGDNKLSSQEISGIKEITINSESSVNNLKELYNLYGLQKLIIENSNLSDLNGIENCSQLYYIFIKNSTIGDYTAIGKLGSKLHNLYFLYATNDELNKLCRGLSNYDLPNLNYLGFFATYTSSVDYTFDKTTNRYENKNRESTELSDISALASLTNVTKNAIKYFYINDNKITSLEALADFTNLYYLRANGNQITSLKGLENKSNLTYLQVSHNKLDDISDVKDDSNVLYAITGNTTLYWLDLKGNKIKWISYLKECSNLKYIYLDDITTIQDEDMSEIKDNIKKANNVVYSPKYSLSLIDNSVSKLSLDSQNVLDTQFKTLKDCTELTYLSLYNTKFINSSGQELGETELNSLLNEVISNFKKLKELSLYNVKFSNFSFITKLSKIEMLDLRNTLITTNNNNGLVLLENNEKMGILAINNDGIDLSKIQKTIERISISKVTSGLEGKTNHIFSSWVSGLICNNSNILKTLEKCTDLTTIKFGMQGYSYYNKNLNLNLANCDKLKEISIDSISFGEVFVPDSVENIDLSQARADLKFTTNSELKGIYLRGNSNIQDILTELGNKCKKLTSIELLSNEGITNFGVLSSCSSLKLLKITGQQWTGKLNYKNINTLNNLKDLPSLEKVDIHWLTIDNLECVKDFAQLINLTVYNTNLTDISQISNLINLTTVDLHNNAITDVESIGKLDLVTSISLNGNYISTGLQTFSNLKKLEWLNLNDNSITDTSTYIDINGNLTRYSVLNILAELNKNYKLKKLYISGNKGIIDKNQLTQSGTNWNVLEK